MEASVGGRGVARADHDPLGHHRPCRPQGGGGETEMGGADRASGLYRIARGVGGEGVKARGVETISLGKNEDCDLCGNAGGGGESGTHSQRRGGGLSHTSRHPPPLLSIR